MCTPNYQNAQNHKELISVLAKIYKHTTLAKGHHVYEVYNKGLFRVAQTAAVHYTHVHCFSW